ncbi:glycoside hydrolase family 16 protein [Serpula lacrymans var. lacrymans S7.9]|uniref:Glycoside hydrolase family 16 protein n=1 Tax=Serpula lacrymans var. lacrymans (strain S7.9) TaxID=578457 RepID=F8NYS5_SERL9|nr:glycoside hydrolase family 16 protein [Serpula lacrymans var. lacrymans S7.9]EGO23746.1 glycoside hydrolase family 16 protein [Serpula lacrymans var. lacrymans S7.9]
MSLAILRLAPLIALLSGPGPALVSAATYNAVKEYSGSTFFNDWTFYNNYDNLTNGDAIFVSASEGASDQLAYVDSSTLHAIIKVDNTTTVPYNQKRNTVRITSNDSFAIGSVWVADMYHVPARSGPLGGGKPVRILHTTLELVVMRLFTHSQAPSWPAGGEIDTFEGVNMMTMNQMSLHTETGCMVENQNQTSTLIQSTNCSASANGNQGCIVQDPSGSSYGAGFAGVGGGAFVTEMAESGINIWFFPRSQIPSSLTSNASTIDTSTFGTAVGNWPSGGCNTTEFFQPQQLIFDITLCGDWAGSPATFNATCTGVCYNDYVIGPASNYNEAYFEIGYVRVFGTEGADTVISPSGSSGVGSGGVPGSTGSPTTGAAVGRGEGWGLVAVVAAVVVGLAVGLAV